MEKNVEKSFIKIGLYFQIAYIVLMAITLCGFVICYGLIFGLFYLLSGSRADYLIVTIVISAIIAMFVPFNVLLFVMLKIFTLGTYNMKLKT